MVPNELSPQAFPQIEALKAQAVAARTYALAHLRDYASKGFDVCATPSCQVYRGQGSEHPLTDRAVRETAGVVATWRGRPINAYYTSTCGGHTEEGEAIFDDAAPYLKGVACPPERASRHVVRTTAAAAPRPPGRSGGGARRGPAGGARGRRGRQAEPSRARGRRPGRRGAGVGGEGGAAAGASSTAGVSCGPRSRAARRPGAQAGRGARPAGRGDREAGTPALAHGELAGSGEGQLSVLHGEAADSHPIDPGVRLFRDVRGAHSGASELALSVGDRVSYVERGGRVVYLEAGKARKAARRAARGTTAGR